MRKRTGVRHSGARDLSCGHLWHQNLTGGDSQPTVVQVPHDILTRILDKASKTGDVTSVDVQDEFSTLFMAGQETTAASMAFLVAFLGQHPDVLEK